MCRPVGKWAVIALLCMQFAGCALRPGSQNVSAQHTQVMGSAAAGAPVASSPEGVAVAAELGYHGPVRRATAAD